MSDTVSTSPTAAPLNKGPLNSPARVLLASLVGTTIEFFDFYVYATAAVLVFPVLFFPNTDPTTALLASFATFSIAFFARPLGAVVFGHFGDRIGRKTTLVAALLTMGVSTVIIGLLPTYEQIGVIAPLLLALCRFGQGFGLGGEWGGAVLLATENAPAGKRSWYGMFPQLGAPVGLFLSSGAFWLLLHLMTQERCSAGAGASRSLPRSSSLASAFGCACRSPKRRNSRRRSTSMSASRCPVIELLRHHKRSLFLGTFVALATFVLFYIGSAYLLSYNVKVLNIPFLDALEIQIVGSILFGIFIPIAGKLAERFGRREVLIATTVLIGIFSFFLNVLMTSGEGAIFVFAIIAMALMGMTYGLIGTALAAPFPTNVRYTGSSITFNLAGIFGASLAPYAATWLQVNYGMAYVGYYLGAAAVITLICILLSGKDEV
jgi:MFS family permease